MLAFCSIVYELLLGQSLSAFLGNTVLRYSVTIGLYMFSMGIGSLFAEGRLVKYQVMTLLKVEILLTFIGGASVVLLHFFDWTQSPAMVFSLLAHSLIVIIGLLTGAEIPLLIEIRNMERKNAESPVLGVDYVGAFAGTLFFAFLFYPVVGLVASAFFIALLNALIGVLLWTQIGKIKSNQHRQYKSLLACQAVLLLLMAAGLVFSEQINDYLIHSYINV